MKNIYFISFLLLFCIKLFENVVSEWESFWIYFFRKNYKSSFILKMKIELWIEDAMQSDIEKKESFFVDPDFKRKAIEIQAFLNCRLVY